ncbi:acyl-CoA dehydrogenase family protein [Nocardia sp. BMG111209]|uniref:acyl-CoA dehydrogenase family protein n=1 Tax=Nocardia sp. BMG111209 TaxID=1160137 RepID=UPI00037EC870|nr:acyl-CoA dehydrogenase family protein [Nocardia sp. BMG111209]
MDFTTDYRQDAVAEVVVSLLERNHERDISLWPELVDSGLLAVALPERYGGDGMGLPEISALLTELATDAVAVPALSTFGFGVLPLLGHLPDDLADKVFPAVAGGAVLTAALHEPGSPFVTSPATTATPRGGEVLISGHKVGVPYAEQAGWILVPTDAGVAVVDADAAGLDRRESPTSTGAAEYSIRLHEVAIPAGHLLSGSALTDLHRSALACLGAVADGLLTGALKLTTEHVRTRHQFGRPLAEFQAVAQEIGDIYVTSRTLHAAALAANWALAQLRGGEGDPDRVDDDLDVLAYCIAAELPAAMQMCHHLHGGIGVDMTHPLHRYYSQAKDITRWLGGESLRLDRLGARCS